MPIRDSPTGTTSDLPADPTAAFGYHYSPTTGFPPSFSLPQPKAAISPHFIPTSLVPVLRCFP